jgi:MarR family transcriptional regulator, organic hydroperoxide resistance regulator
MLRSLFDDLVRAQIELWNAVDRRLRAETELTLARFDVMRVISAHQGCRVADVAADMAITVGGASKIVDRLADAGLCERRSNPDDRRSALVELTALGEERLAAASVVFDVALDELLGGVLDQSSLERLAADLRALRVHTTKGRHTHD